MDFFYDYKLHKTNNGYEVILFMRPNSTLEEFAEEFGLTKRSEEDINRIAVGYVKRSSNIISKLTLMGASDISENKLFKKIDE